MKYAADRPYADPGRTARRLMELAQTKDVVQEGCIDIEKINYPFLFKDKVKPAEYDAGLKLAIERGRLCTHQVDVCENHG